MLELSVISAAYGLSAGLQARHGKENMDSSGFSFVTLVLSLLHHALTCTVWSRPEPAL